MALTYTLINSSVLGSSAANVTFSSIPSTYTDLVLRTSVRLDSAGAWASYYSIYVNSLTTGFSSTYLAGSGSGTAFSSRAPLDSIYPNIQTNSSGNTANTFTNDELYIPNYTVSTNKPMLAHSASENNTTAAYTAVLANLMSNTAAINSLRIDPDGAVNFVAGSSFYLYGIKNS
jgi:hypothetical protein